MALPVDVSSVDVLEAVRESLALFGDDAKHALGAMEMEIRRCIDWLTHDQRIHWQTEIKRRKEDLSNAKAELFRKQLGAKDGSNAHDSEQREAVRKAKVHLEEAEEKLETVRRWIPQLEQAVGEYDGRARPLADMLEYELQQSIAMVDRMIVAIEEYSRIAPPETQPARPAVGASSAPAAVSTTGTIAAPPASKAEAEPATQQAEEAGPAPVEEGR